MCPTSSLVSCLVYRVSSHASSRVSSCVSKSRESPKITDKSDEMMAKIGMKIKAEIAPNRFQGDSRGTQNRLKIAPRSLPGTPWRPRSSQGPSGAFSTCPGIFPGSSRQRPCSARRVPKGGPERQEERPGAPWSASGRSKSTPRRHRDPKKRVFCVRRACAPFTERLFDDFCRFSDFL